MFDDYEIIEEFDTTSNLYENEINDETVDTLVDYFNARAFKDIDSDHDTPFRKWHMEEDVKEMNVRIMEC